MVPFPRAFAKGLRLTAWALSLTSILLLELERTLSTILKIEEVADTLIGKKPLVNC